MSEEVKQEGEFKIKKRPKKLAKKEETVKLDLTKKEEPKKQEDAVQEPSAEKVDVQEPPSNGEAVGTPHAKGEEVTEKIEEKKEEVISPITEITSEKKEEVKQEIKKEQPIVEKDPLPENVEKLVEFMKETGGTLEDYVRISADYSNVDTDTLLKEFYKHTKPHLDSDEIQFILEDKFMYNEDIDEEREVKVKKLAYKEEVAKARGFLDDLKSKYYAEIKLRPGITQEQQKATDFFNRYNEDLAKAEKASQDFKDRTNEFFNNEFEGFEFKVGDKRFNYKVNDVQKSNEKQSSISNFLNDYLVDGKIVDLKKYHKALYAARNADSIASHFYEQGKSDATKSIMSKSKNINDEPRKVSNGEVFVNGWKVKAISGVDSSKLKIKKSNKN